MSGQRPGHRVVVIGSGWAGLAAATAAVEGHASVVLVDGGAGASALGPGALDDVPWEERARADAVGVPLVATEERPESGRGADLAWIAGVLGGGAYQVVAGGEPLALLATTGGRVRPARGHDAALLDLARLPEGSRVIVPRADRPGWDADALARTWSAEPHALARRLAFDAVDADVLRFDDERRLPDADLASRHDDPARLGWLAERLREAVGPGGAAAVVLGPWLGQAPGRAAALSRALGLAAGEALAPLATTAGLRFEAARRPALEAAGVRVVHGRARAVTRVDDGLRVALAMGEPLAADAVVLAIGGLVGGGITYAPPEHGAGPEGADVVAAPMRASVACGVRVELRGEVGPGSSTFGPALDDVAWPTGASPGALEQAGVRADDVARAAGLAGALFAAGDAVARRPRTVGEAVASGRRAGRDAAS
jgi:glycerol-3-phosphate dehydrogenase subunit B